MNSRVFRWALLMIVLTFGVKVFAHARILQSGALAPRLTNGATGMNNAGIKTGPCGGYPKVANPPVFQPGQTITVNWEETIDHPGRYEFYFSPANDQNFGPALRVVIDNQDTPVVNGQYHQYSTTVTLPNVQCANCTLQMIQYMTETNPPSLYYSCADLQVGNNPPPNPVPGPTPGPGPAPAPSPHCN